MTDHAPATTAGCVAVGPDLLGQVVVASAGWVNTATGVLAGHRWVTGAWLAGSMGRGEADAFSDVDLVVAVDDTVPPEVFTDPFGGLGLPGAVCYRRPKPRDAPAGGAYLAVALELAGLPVLVDLYVWPSSTAAIPAGGRLLFEHSIMPRSELGLLALLGRCPATDSTGSDPDDPATVLLLIQLAIKYHARGDRQRRAGICHQFQIPDMNSVAEIRELLTNRLATRRPATAPALAAVHRLLNLVSHLKQEAPMETPTPAETGGRRHALTSIICPGGDRR